MSASSQAPRRSSSDFPLLPSLALSSHPQKCTGEPLLGRDPDGHLSSRLTECLLLPQVGPAAPLSSALPPSTLHRRPPKPTMVDDDGGSTATSSAAASRAKTSKKAGPWPKQEAGRPPLARRGPCLVSPLLWKKRVEEACWHSLGTRWLVASPKLSCSWIATLLVVLLIRVTRDPGVRAPGPL